MQRLLSGLIAVLRTLLPTPLRTPLRTPPFTPPQTAPRRGQTAVRLIAALLLSTAISGGAVQAQPLPLPLSSSDNERTGPTLRVDAALSAVEEGGDFPVDGPTLSVSLPDEWAQTRPGFAGSVWYRVAFATPASSRAGELLGLYVARVCSSLQVSLNGQLLHTSKTKLSRGEAPTSHDCSHPQLISLPAALLLPTGNLLDIRVTGYALSTTASRLRAGGLSALLIGPFGELSPLHERQTALQIAAPQALSASLLLMGGFMFVLGFINRRDSHLAYFGALCLGWSLLGTRLWLRHVPLAHSSAEFLVCALMGFVTWAAVQFLLRHAGTRSRVLDVGLPLQCMVIVFSLLLAGPDRLNALSNFWHALLWLETLAAALWYLRHVWRQRAVWAAAALCLTVLVNGAIQAMVQWGRGGKGGTAPDWATQAAPSADWVLPVMMVLVGLRLVQQHGRARQQAEQGQAQLELRMRGATAEIEHNFRQLAELRVEQVTERERKRIAADLHDDLGAKLLTIVHTSDSERISSLAREALEEMRLSVRGLTGKPVRLADALGDWRAEVISRLLQAGIEGQWEAPEDLPQTLSARAYVQTTRILREATSNIIKHSGARQCAVTVSLAQGDFQLVVQDDGVGISNEVDARLDRGHGLASMKNRAKQLQGQCLVESGPGFGTVIRLTLPLNRTTEAS